MDDVYRINVAKTEFREAYDTGNVEGLIAVFNAQGFTNMSEGESSKYGTEALSNLREQAAALFEEYSVKLTPIIINIVVLGDTAYDYGWHEFIFHPRNGGPATRKRQRYFELWKKDSDGNWKISLYMNNGDVPEELAGQQSHWYLSSANVPADSRLSNRHSN